MDGFPTLMLWMVTALPFAFSFAVNFLIIKQHSRIGIYAKDDKRRHHRHVVPLLGGVGITIGMIVSYGFLIYCKIDILPKVNTLCLLLAYLVSFAFGIADDIVEIRPFWKFLGQNATATLLLFALRRLDTPVDGLIGHNFAAEGIKYFWALGLLNSLNLIDGLDELAGGLGIIALAFLMVLEHRMLGIVSPFYPIAVCSIIGFYLWNRHPAKIFLGESGTSTIAISIFVASMFFKSSANPVTNFVAPLFAVAIPIGDTALAMLRRLMRQTPISKGDREHVHHRLLRLGLSHPNAVRVLHGLAIYLCVVACQFITAQNFSAGGLGLVVAGIGINIFIMMTAEQKLYNYLTNFASHMLKIIDQNGSGSKTAEERMEELKNKGSSFVAYRLDMRDSIRALLEKSPGKIQLFYSKLSNALSALGGHEIYLESSTSALILQVMNLGDIAEFMAARERLFEQLTKFENEEKVDLMLERSKILELVFVEQN